MPILIPLFWRIFAHFENWILTLKSYNFKTSQPNLKSYTSKSKLDYPLSNESIFRVIQEIFRSHETDKRPKFFLDHPVTSGLPLPLIPASDSSTSLSPSSHLLAPLIPKPDSSKPFFHYQIHQHYWFHHQIHQIHLHY